MSEEKKEQSDFLSGHEELLNSINKKNDVPAEAEPVAEAAPVVEEPAPVAEPEAVVEETPAEEPVAEKPAPVAEPEPEPEPVIEEPEPVVEEEPEPVIEKPDPAPVAEEPEPVIEDEPEPVAEEVAEEVPVVDQAVVADVPPVVTEKPAHPAPKKKKPANHQEAVKQRHDALEQAEVKEVLNFINKYVKPAGIVVLIVCGLFLGNSLLRSTRMKKEAKADAALMDAKNAADYQAILDDYGQTPSAPMAMLGLAQEKFNAAQVAEAADLYADFLKKFPKHDMAVQAKYNSITCQEAMGQYAEAAAAYGEFWAQHKASHLAPVALLGKARCLESTGNFAEAKQAYVDVTTFYEDSGWAQLAEQNLSVVNAKLK